MSKEENVAGGYRPEVIYRGDQLSANAQLDDCSEDAGSLSDDDGSKKGNEVRQIVPVILLWF